VLSRVSAPTTCRWATISAAGSVTATGTRFYESQIDGGWITRYNGAWTIVDGVMINAATNSGGHPEACPAESALAQVVSNYGDGDTVTLRFDYNVAAGDTLYVHFWGYTGVLVNADNFIGNTEACNGHYYNDENMTELNAFNFKDGADSFQGFSSTAISGALTGSGSYSNAIRVADLNIAGVDSMADISYISLVFCKDENGQPGTTSVDNVSVTLSPATLRVGADNTSAVFAGTIREGDGDSVLGFTKVGSGTQTLAGTNTYSGPTIVLDGTLALGADNALADASVLVLDGGTLDAGSATDTIGALDLRSDSTLHLDGCRLTFGDSTGFDWSGSLELTGALRSTTLRFIPAITEDQLLRITYQGTRVYSTEDGYIVALRGTVILVR
jgi:autotransporter-associated beta strand protein